MNKKYYTEAERKEAERERKRRWREKNKDKNKEHFKEINKKYQETLKGYSRLLYHQYIRNDKKYGRVGEELPEDYITVDDIKLMIQQPCIYNCGETDWRKMGVDRIDNSLPHIKSNCVASCTKCNIERGQKDYNEFLKSKCK
jgi:hypothetical protein